LQNQQNLQQLNTPALLESDISSWQIPYNAYEPQDPAVVPVTPNSSVSGNCGKFIYI